MHRSLRAAAFHTSILRVVAVGLASAAVLGCSSGSSQRVSLLVRDAATGEPVAQARVEALATKFFLPVDPYPTLDPADHKPSRGETGPDGAIELRLAADLPSRLTVEAPGYDRWQGLVEPTRGAARWWITGVTHTPPVGATGPTRRLNVDVRTP